MSRRVRGTLDQDLRPVVNPEGTKVLCADWRNEKPVANMYASECNAGETSQRSTKWSYLATQGEVEIRHIRRQPSFSSCCQPPTSRSLLENCSG